MENPLKINNSYESEPSSGSAASSLSEPLYYFPCDDENMHLPDMLKPPPNYDEPFAVPAVSEASNMVVLASLQSPATVANKLERAERCGIPLHSSQESSFEGFNDSPFGKVQRMLYREEVAVLPPPPAINCVPFALYETVMAENSCNAVDLTLANNQQVTDPNESCCQSIEICGPILSFDGQIKSLQRPEVNMTEPLIDSCVNEVAEESISNNDVVPPVVADLTSSFALQRYTNEKSPDLFADDEDSRDPINRSPDMAESNNLASQAKEEAENPPPVTNSFEPSTSHCCHTPPTELIANAGDINAMAEPQIDLGFRDNCRRESELLRRIRKCLSGLPPPPSLTTLQLEMFNEVVNRKHEMFNYLQDVAKLKENGDQTRPQEENDSTTSLFKPTHSLPEIQAMRWEEVRSVRQHGLCYNWSAASESNELLALSIIDRFVGAETTSSYRNSPSSVKKKTMRMRLIQQSPGNRLSHLAKRRAVFSSAHLATTSNKFIGPQISLDKKSSRHRRKATPRRKTPGSKRKNRKTPSSSARKRLFHCALPKPGPSRETSKRALFQSPAKDTKCPKAENLLLHAKTHDVVAHRIERSKRALFSPDTASGPTASSSSCGFSRTNSRDVESLFKRKRAPEEEGDETSTSQAFSGLSQLSQSSSNKLFRGASSSDCLTPRSLGIKSRSFCLGAATSSSTMSLFNASNATSMDMLSTGRAFMTAQVGATVKGSAGELNFPTASSKLQRAQSEMTASSNSLTENQRKKLLWAVSLALQERKITAKHEHFKQYASVLARVVKRIFQEYHQKGTASNSETMLRLSKKYAYNVITGRSTDDVYYQAKAQIDDAKRQSCSRLSGYIGPKEYMQLQRTISDVGENIQAYAPAHLSHATSLQNLLSGEASLDSFSASVISQKTLPLAETSVTASTSFYADSVEITTATSAAVVAQSSLVLASSLQTVNQEAIIAQEQLQLSQTTLAAAQQQLNILPNPTLLNSSSKNNLSGMALRENVDCEQRRSTQKSFTGKDQRNMSPYVGGAGSVSGSAQRTSIYDLNATSSAKVKRHIMFDS